MTAYLEGGRWLAPGIFKINTAPEELITSAWLVEGPDFRQVGTPFNADTPTSQLLTDLPTDRCIAMIVNTTHYTNRFYATRYAQ